MRLIIISLILCIPFLVPAQINQTDAEGLRQGKWEKRYPSGKLIYVGQFKNGEPVGDWTRFYPGGIVKAKIHYAENSDSAFVQLFSERGKKIAEGNYVNEKRAGKWTLYSGDIKISEENYVDGEKHGVSMNFYPTGELFDRAEWKNGVQEGKYEVFFKNGEPYMQCKYSEGKRNGLCLSYFKNGRVEMEAYYKNNLRNGEWKFYNEEGDHLYTLKYDEGKLLNPEVRDSIGNQQMEEMEKGRHNIPDPEKFMQDPSEYMMQMERFR